jgi:hypothetical protein
MNEIRKTLALFYMMLDDFASSIWTTERIDFFFLKYHMVFDAVRKSDTVREVDKDVSYITAVCKSVMQLTAHMEWYWESLMPVFEEKRGDILFWRTLL